jgi:glycosyltransferase involved in cell wall biosynthesis
VASDVGGNPELVEHARSGLLFPRGNAEGLAAQLRCLLRQKNLIALYAANGCERIRAEFTLAAAADRMQSIYDEFLNSQGRQEIPAGAKISKQEPSRR